MTASSPTASAPWPRAVRSACATPYSTRPYQHVLEPLAAYLLIAQRQYEDSRFAGYYNVGPDDCDCVTTGTLVDLFCGPGAATPPGRIRPRPMPRTRPTS